MAYERGIKIAEEATVLTAMTRVEAPTVALGTASKGTAGQPVLVHSMDAFEEEFGFTGNFDNTLEEVAYTYFKLYNVAPVVFINVPKAADAPAVTNANVIAALSQVERVYPRLGMVPGTIIAPKFSSTPEVALAMAAKAQNINGVFKSFALADINLPDGLFSNAIADLAVADNAVTDLNAAGDLVYQFKNTHSLTNEFLAVCWPRIGFGEKTYWLSTQMAALMDLVDANNGQIPFESPSNKLLRCDRSLTPTEGVFLSHAEASTLNGQGIVTALNFNAWRLWGNRSSIYPDNDDPKDSFIPCRRMMNWLGNTLAINYFSRIDAPINRRLVDSIVDEVNLFLSGLTSQGVLLGGKIAFLEEDNPKTSLADGLIKFRIDYASPTPARAISFTLSYDVNYFNSLFS